MKPYIPELLPLKNIRWDNFVHLIGKANYELAKYEGILQRMINPIVLLSPLINREAVLSSRIEGSQATAMEAYEFEASQIIDESKREDAQEIINYRRSILFATEWLVKKPLTLNLIREIHKILLDSVRGRNKGRGEFRTSQNYIGRPGATLEEASYVPPPPGRVIEFLSNLEKYIHYDEKDIIVQMAVIHAQFEIIHPFLDGNGRVGRILVPLFLYEKRVLKTPTFYISAYMETNRQTYYEKLNQISREGDWNDWISFFLTAVIEQAVENSQKATEMLDLYDELKKTIPEVVKSRFAIQTLDAIFERPVFGTSDFTKISRIPEKSAFRILSVLRDNEIIDIYRERKGRRPALMGFPRLLSILK